MLCSPHSIHCCLHTKHLNGDGKQSKGFVPFPLGEEVWVQCSPIWDLLMLNSDPDLNTHKFTGRSSQRVSAEGWATYYPHCGLRRHTSINLRMNYWRHTTPTMFLTWAGISGCSRVQGPCCIRIRGANLFKFWCFAHAVCVALPFFYLSIPLLYLSFFPSALFSHSAESYQNDFPPHVLLRHYFLIRRCIAMLSISW